MKIPEKLSLEERMMRFPPIVCFIIARTWEGPNRKVTALTAEQIAERSGLPIDRVYSLSWLTNWDTVPCREMFAYSRGCGIDFEDSHCMKINSTLLLRRQGRYLHLKGRPDYMLYQERIALYRKAITERKI